jgi:mRNA interferase HigB
VTLTGLSELEAFKRKHPESRKALDSWRKVIEASSFNTFTELKAAFPSADYVKGFIVFDIRGNKYRLVAVVVFREGRCIIDQIMTHDDYMKWSGRIR